MYVNKCTKCGKEFETKNPKRVICPDCLYPDKKPLLNEMGPSEGPEEHQEQPNNLTDHNKKAVTETEAAIIRIEVTLTMAIADLTAVATVTDVQLWRPSTRWVQKT
jgi:hypothetical protein